MDSRLSLLSAMRLKQWRVPRALSLDCCLTKPRTWSMELAVATRSVLNSKLPDQFLSLSSGMALRRGTTAGVAIAADNSLRKLRLFMAPENIESVPLNPVLRQLLAPT